MCVFRTKKWTHVQLYIILLPLSKDYETGFLGQTFHNFTYGSQSPSCSWEPMRMVMDASCGVPGQEMTTTLQEQCFTMLPVSECAAMAQGSEARVFLLVPFNFSFCASWSMNLSDSACASMAFLFNVKHGFAWEVLHHLYFVTVI